MIVLWFIAWLVAGTPAAGLGETWGALGLFALGADIALQYRWRTQLHASVARLHFAEKRK